MVKMVEMGRPGSDGRDLGNVQSIDQGKYLTDRQDQVIRLAMNGMSSKEIARHLGISKRTVDAHFDRARERLGAANRNALVSIVAVADTDPADDGRGPAFCPETNLISRHLARVASRHASQIRKGPGRPTVMTDQLIAAARDLLSAQSVAAVARALGVSRTTLYAHMDQIRRAGLEMPGLRRLFMRSGVV